MAQEERERVVAAAIRDYPDFPKAKVVFKDILPVLRQPAAFRACVDWLKSVTPAKTTVIIGAESRGFFFACPLALELGLPFVPARKIGKVPGALFTDAYELEYGTSELCIQQDALDPADRCFIVDDLLATGGTLMSIARLVAQARASTCGAACIINVANVPKAPGLTAEVKSMACLVDCNE